MSSQQSECFQGANYFQAGHLVLEKSESRYMTLDTWYMIHDTRYMTHTILTDWQLIRGLRHLSMHAASLFSLQTLNE